MRRGVSFSKNSKLFKSQVDYLFMGEDSQEVDPVAEFILEAFRRDRVEKEAELAEMSPAIRRRIREYEARTGRDYRDRLLMKKYAHMRRTGDCF